MAEFYSSSALDHARRLPDPEAAAYLISQLNWETPDEDHFMDLALFDPVAAQGVYERIEGHDSVVHQHSRYKDALVDGREFQRLCASTDEERDAAAVLVSLFPTGSQERARKASVLVLAELRCRPEHAATLALSLWEDSHRFYQYWLKDIIYTLVYQDPRKLMAFLTKLWERWKPRYCQYYFSEAHDVVCAFAAHAIERGERTQLGALPFLIRYRGGCPNDKETLELLADRLSEIPQPLARHLLTALVSHAHRHGLFEKLLPHVQALPEPDRNALLWRLARTLNRGLREDDYDFPVRRYVRQLQRLTDDPELLAYLKRLRLRLACDQLWRQLDNLYQPTPEQKRRFKNRVERPWTSALPKEQTRLRRKCRRLG